MELHTLVCSLCASDKAGYVRIMFFFADPLDRAVHYLGEGLDRKLLKFLGFKIIAASFVFWEIIATKLHGLNLLMYCTYTC